MNIIGLVVLLLCSSASLASEWHITDVGSHEALYFYDAATLRHNESTITVWLSVYANPKTTNRVAMLKEKDEINCTSGQDRVLEVVSYDTDERILERVDTPTKWKEPVPDTMGDRLVNEFCKADFDPHDTESLVPDPASRSKWYFDSVNERQSQKKH
jgi:hypothetical protein